MKRFLVIAAMILLCGLGKAQWVQTSGIAGSDVMNLGVLGSTVFAATMYSGTFYSNDFGNNWTPTAYGVNVAMGVGGFAVAGTVIYGCGDNALHKSSDYGLSWQTIPIPSSSGGSVAISGSDIYIGGSGGLGVFKANLGDSNWVIAGLQGNTIHNLFFGAGAIWAATNDGLYRLQGGAWAPVLAGDGFNSMAFSGTSVFAGGHQGVRVSEDNGSTWSLIQSGEAVDANTLLVAGGKIFAGCWNGIFSSGLSANINWTRIVNGLDFWRVHSLASVGSLIFAGVCGGVYVSGDGGASWSGRNTGLIGTNCFLRTNGGRMIAGGNPNGFWYTTNDGDHWTEISNGLNRYDHILLELHDLAFAGSTYFAGTEDHIYYSSDLGNNWVRDTLGLPSMYVYAVTTAGGWVYATGGGNGISGVSRANLSDMHFYPFTDGMPSTDVQLLKTIADTDIWAGTCDQGIMRRGMSGAKPWQPMNNGITNTCIMALAGDAGCMFAGTYDGFYRSYTHGASWEKIENPWVGAVGGIAVKGDTVFIMSNNGIYYSKNQGSSFSDVKGPYFFGGPSIFIGDHNVFVGTTDVGVWKRAWSDIHTFHLTVDSVVLMPLLGSRDSLYIECDTNWTIQGYIPDFLSVSRLSGKGNGYVVFTATLANTNDYELINAFELHSYDGQVLGFTVRQQGKSYGISEPGCSGVTIWPNPSAGLFNIRCGSPIRSVKVFTEDGVAVNEISFTGSETEVSIATGYHGLLFVRVQTTDVSKVCKLLNHKP